MTWRRSRWWLAQLALFGLVAGASFRTTALGVFADSSSAAANTFSTASAFCASTYRDTVLATPGLVSYWRLGESSGTSASDSAGTNAGTYSGGAVLGQPGLIACDSDTAVALDGINDYVSVPDDDASLDFSSSFTLEAWVKLDALPTTSPAVILGKSSTGYYVSVDTNDTWMATLKQGGGWRSVSSSTTAATGQVYHVVVTNDSSLFKLYVNGVEVGSSNGGNANTTTAPFTMGAFSSTSSLLDGTIDEAAVYNTPLTATEVSDHYTRGASP